MTVEVHKFGGSCLRDSSDLDRIADALGMVEEPVVVVVSALWGTTDRLMRAAKEPRYAGRLVNDLASQHLRFAPTIVKDQAYERFQRVLHGIEDALSRLATDRSDRSARNRLLAAGERLSALVVAHHLKGKGLDAHAVGAEDIGLKLNGTHIAGRVDLEASASRLDTVALSGLPVVTGWFGEGADGQLALLGRGGSDHTATALAALLEASKVVLWKDVDGIHPLNPRWGITTQPVPYLGYSQAIEFANADATVLHPATVEPVLKLGIPIEIRHLNGRHAKASTVIGPDVVGVSGIRAVSVQQKVARVRTSMAYIHDSQRVLSQVLSAFSDKSIRLHTYQIGGQLWEFIVPQHEVHRVRTVFKDAGLEATHDFFSALITMIGCGENIANELDGNVLMSWSHEPMYVTQSTSHLLTQRDDISLLMEEVFHHLPVNRPT